MGIKEMFCKGCGYIGPPGEEGLCPGCGRKMGKRTYRTTILAACIPLALLLLLGSLMQVLGWVGKPLQILPPALSAAPPEIDGALPLPPEESKAEPLPSAPPEEPVESGVRLELLALSKTEGYIMVKGTNVAPRYDASQPGVEAGEPLYAWQLFFDGGWARVEHRAQEAKAGETVDFFTFDAVAENSDDRQMLTDMGYGAFGDTLYIQLVLSPESGQDIRDLRDFVFYHRYGSLEYEVTCAATVFDYSSIPDMPIEVLMTANQYERSEAVGGDSAGMPEEQWISEDKQIVMNLNRPLGGQEAVLVLYRADGKMMRFELEEEDGVFVREEGEVKLIEAGENALQLSWTGTEDGLARRSEVLFTLLWNRSGYRPPVAAQEESGPEEEPQETRRYVSHTTNASEGFLPWVALHPDGSFEMFINGGGATGTMYGSYEEDERQVRLYYGYLTGEWVIGEDAPESFTMEKGDGYLVMGDVSLGFAFEGTVFELE